MRRLALLIGFLALPGFGAITRVGSAIQNTALSVTTVSVSYTATLGNALVVVCGSYGTSSLTSMLISDGSNTYTLDQFQAAIAGTGERESVSHAPVTTAGALTITCTANFLAPFGMTVAVAEYSGVSTSLDGSPVSANGTSTALNSGNLTTANPADLLIGGLISGSGGAITAGSGWTMVQSSATGNPASVGLEEQIVSSTGTYAATATSSSGRWASILVAFKASAPAGNKRKHRVIESDSGWVPNGTVTQSLVATDGFYDSSVNVTSVSKNALVTAGGKQYACYTKNAAGTNIIIAVRTLPNGAWSATDTGFSNGGGDEHYACSMAVDTAGYIHLCYGMHNVPLIYRRSVNPLDVSAFTSILPMLGTNESSVTYPIFITRPSTGQIYFTFRDGGSGNGNQYFYGPYNVGTTTWVAAAGTGSGGIVMLGIPDNLSAYMNIGQPPWDSHENLWWSWSWNAIPSINEYLMKWDGSAFKTFGGSAQTIPATTGNTTPILTTSSSNLNIQQGFCIDSGDVIYIPLAMNDGSSSIQTFVLESSTGSFVSHQLTSSSGASLSNTLPVPYPSCVSVGGKTYVLWPDNFVNGSGTVGAGPVAWGLRHTIAAVSSDHFATWATFWPNLYYNPNWELNPDPSRLASGVVSYMFQDTNDLPYGATYIAPPNISTLGYVSVIDWSPK